MKVNRSYKLKLYGNVAKTDTAKYTLSRFKLYCDSFLGRLFFGNKIKSTAGMGETAHRALRKSEGIIRALKTSSKATGNKINVPYKPNVGCNALISESKNSSFDYWITVSNMWTKFGFVRIPAKSHKALNKALRNGWIMSNACEFKIINGNPYAVVFVSKKRPAISKPKNILGIDVGMKHSIACSDRYLGHGLSSVIRKNKRRTSERRRQGHKISSKVKTVIKQLLDREAKTILRRSQKSSAAIAVENPKRLANLRSGKLQGWARSYFANRLHILGAENGVKVIDVSPYQTSITCSNCGVVNKESRRSRDEFVCLICGHKDHADVNASVVIAQKGARLSGLDNFLEASG